MNKDHFTEKSYFGASAASRPSVRNRRPEGHSRSNNMTPKTMNVRVFRLQANLSHRNVTSSLQSRDWQTGDHQNNTSTNTRVVWQQSAEISVQTSKLAKNLNDPTSEAIKKNQTPDQKEGQDVDSQTSPIGGGLHQTSQSEIRYETVPRK